MLGPWAMSLDLSQEFFVHGYILSRRWRCVKKLVEVISQLCSFFSIQKEIHIFLVASEVAVLRRFGTDFKPAVSTELLAEFEFADLELFIHIYILSLYSAPVNRKAFKPSCQPLNHAS